MEGNMITRGSKRRKRQMRRNNILLIESIRNVLEEYELGVDRRNPGYMYDEDELNSPFINTQLCQNKLYYILEILGTPDSMR